MSRLKKYQGRILSVCIGAGYGVMMAMVEAPLWACALVGGVAFLGALVALPGSRRSRRDYRGGCLE